ncbi:MULTISPECIES: 3-aminobutyryl-CoA ammonia lyase [Streptomyces]|uniref:3-aminobutyryl-CoA ammonia lyase n=1 Tax=Streptomyces cyaneochromogenes TaxID=2496836 RepID=A0A3Q9ETJ6_9ACTN|nr:MULTISPECIES: 3-aminobutyryl-CoA ammonia lyase [Streptomyces]AZQ38780.1 3-aminobutyryl-CoA ammonia lyase [Streptomyces cyaneochromogenes]MCL8015548.1 3-aminobutyryl-CoA ammonia lyase [Streptomyces sp. AS02]
MSEAVSATLRMRMGQKDARYGGNLVDGACILQLFGDVVTEITIQTDGDEGLLTGYSEVEFKAPVFAGDYVEVTGRLVGRSRLRRIVEFTARKYIAARYDLGGTRAEVLDEPLVVCRAVGTAVIPPAAARRRSSGAGKAAVAHVLEGE